MWTCYIFARITHSLGKRPGSSRNNCSSQKVSLGIFFCQLSITQQSFIEEMVFYLDFTVQFNLLFSTEVKLVTFIFVAKSEHKTGLVLEKKNT